MSAGSHAAQREGVKDALAFRAFRYVLFPNAKDNENQLELNEGITEYTGIMMSERSPAEIKTHLVSAMDNFLSDQSYIRSFAYQTVPAYGYLLVKIDPAWNKKIDLHTNLAQFFAREFGVGVPRDIKNYVTIAKRKYNGEGIIADEENRQQIKEKQLEVYRSKFIRQPHFEIRLEKMNISFEYKLLVPLDSAGTVYPHMRITDKWGILTVQSGGLLSADWSRVTLSIPNAYSPQNITGDGWTLELRPGYTVRKDIFDNNYYLTRKN
jgi:hypothetical protein